MMNQMICWKMYKWRKQEEPECEQYCIMYSEEAPEAFIHGGKSI